MKTFSTKRIKKLQENTKTVDINEVIHLKNYIFLVSIMYVSETHAKNNLGAKFRIRGECTLSQKQGALQTQWFFLFLGCI